MAAGERERDLAGGSGGACGERRGEEEEGGEMVRTVRCEYCTRDAAETDEAEGD
jgi:hypothetical protein